MNRFFIRMALLFALLAMAVSGAIFYLCLNAQPAAGGSSGQKAQPGMPAKQALGETLSARKSSPLQKGKLEKPLPLKLLGIMSQKKEEERESVAILRDLETKANSLYREGEALPHGARLVEISVTSVKVARADGTLQTLTLSTESDSKGSKSKETVTELAANERLVNQEAIRRSAFPVMLELSHVKVKPQVDEGRLVGFRVGGVSSKGLLSRLGLQEGDVISEINGTRPTNYRDTTRLLGEAMQQSSLTVTMIRGEKRQTLTYYMAR